MFLSSSTPKESISGHSPSKGNKKGTLKAISMENSTNDHMKKVQAPQ